MWVYTYVHMHVYKRVIMCTYVLYIIMWVWLRVTGFQTVRTIRTGNGRLKPDMVSCSLWTRYTCDSKIIPWDDPDIHNGSCSEDQITIRFKTTSFHVSICFCLFPYLLLSISTCVLLLSFHVTVWDILLVLSLVSLHETSMIVHLICIVDMSLYQYHFMRL